MTDLHMEAAAGTSSPARTNRNVSTGTPAPLKAPRALIWEFLLHFFTFGLYTCFWMVGRARDLRRINQAPVTPWLWFFVPLLVIPEFIALPLLTRYLREAETNRGLPGWGAWRHLWVAAVLATSLFFYLVAPLDIPPIAFIPALATWSLLFTVIEARFNRLKRTATECAMQRNQYGLSIAEWMVLVPVLPIVTASLVYLAMPAGLSKEEFVLADAGPEFRDPAGHFHFPIRGDGWQIVKPGTISDDTTEVELSRNRNSAFAMVFHYTDSNLNELVYDRRSAFLEGMENVHCQEHRSLTKGYLGVAVSLDCRGGSPDRPEFRGMGIIETDNGIYELVTYFSGPRASYEQQEQDVRAMTKGLQPQ